MSEQTMENVNVEGAKEIEFDFAKTEQEVFENKYGEQFRPEWKDEDEDEEEAKPVEAPKQTLNRANLKDLMHRLNELGGDISQLREILNFMENNGFTISSVYDILQSELDSRTNEQNKIYNAEVIL